MVRTCPARLSIRTTKTPARLGEARGVADLTGAEQQCNSYYDHSDE